MINQPISTKLVKIYFFVCHKYETELQYHSQRFTSNDSPDVFPILLNAILKQYVPAGILTNTSLLDSMPIITCSGKRYGKVASDITDKSFCATKNLYYYGVKLHALGFSSPGHLPHPESIIISKASESDLNIFKRYWSEMLTPIKTIQDQPTFLKQMEKAFNDCYSRAVSAIRQPIEALFSWIIAKTDIQRASKVQSTNDLKVHIFGKLTAAFLTLIF
jgi:hypothetical protein